MSRQVLELVRRSATSTAPRGRRGITGPRARKGGLRLLVAVSGGRDSMVLLHVLHELSASEGWRLTVAHFNHQLRGRSSWQDEALVRSTCAALGLHCVAGRGDVQRHARIKSVSVEMAARELRHRFLTRAARLARCSFLITAHHADDQAELVLLRLLRGSGSEGLAGMGHCDPSPMDGRLRILRPLLAVSRREIAVYARRHGIRFREDASNRSIDHLRNRVRHELLPLLRRGYQPAVDRVLCRTSGLLRAEEQWMDDAVSIWLKRRRPAFDRLPLALQRRAVRLQARGLGVEIDFEAVERLVQSPGTLVNVSGNRFLQRRADGSVIRGRTGQPRFARSERLVLLSDRPREVVFGRLALSLRLRQRRGAVRVARTPARELFDARAVGERVLLRHWRRGDRFQPIGMKTAVKLQDLFTNAKVPATERRSRVVAEAANGELFWVEGLRIGERFKITAGTRRLLEWAWKTG